MLIKLSIIVPIYNVALYLRKCVDSLLAQDISDYEIILVDDGSTDNSGTICDEYATIDNRQSTIKALHQPNGGLSSARNSGIKAAEGEYLMFVDSDDYIEPNVLKELLEQVERDKLDVLRYNYQNVRIVESQESRAESQEVGAQSEYEVFNPNKDPKRDVDYSELVVDGETFLNERLGPGCYAWQFILRRDLIYSRLSTLDSCLFTEGIYFEDTEWTPRMLLKAKRVASTSIVVNNYLWRTGSITLPTDPIKRKKVIEDKMALIHGFQEQQKFVKDPKWFIWMTTSVTMSILNSIAILPVHEHKQYIQELKSMHIFPLLAKREKVRTHRIKIHMANISPTLYCFLMNIRAKS